MIRFDSISKSYSGKILFSNLTLSLNKGEKCALLGRNGSGKTTFFRLITGLESADAGEIYIPKNYRIGMLAQHATWKKESPIEEAEYILDENDQWKASKMLYNLGFDDTLISAPISSLSGGYCLRLQLAKLLLSEPDLLLLDEPTNYLDIKTITWLTQFLKRWPKEILAISHDRDFLDAISTHTIGLHRQELVRIQGKTNDYFTYILKKEEEHQKLVEKTSKQKEHLQNFIQRFGAKASKAKQAKSKQKMIDRLPELESLNAMSNLDFEFRQHQIEAQILIELNHVGFGYSHKTQPSDSNDQKGELFNNLSFQLSQGSRFCFAGRNGRGKSTLLRVILGDLQPTSGKVKYHPQCKIGYFGQTNIDRLDPTKTIEEEILISAPDLAYQQIKAICGAMMFTQDDSKKRIGVLSGGEKSRVLLAKILATPVNVLLLDEPTNHLDLESIEALINALESFDGAVVLVSHSELLLSRISESMVIFEDDEVFVYPDSYSLFLKEKGWKTDAPIKQETETKTLSSKHQKALSLQEKSKTLSPVKREIERIEKSIAESEALLKKTEANLLKVIESKLSHDIERESKELSRIEKFIEKLFEDLEVQYLKKIEIESGFEE